MNQLTLLLKTIPQPIFLHILSYTYQPQKKELQEDIINYVKNRQIIKQLYCNFWMDLWHLDYINAMYWLDNDLLYFINSYIPMKTCYCEKFYNIFMRLYSIHTENDVCNFVAKLLLRNKSENYIIRNVNVLFALLNTNEREEFISGFIHDVDITHANVEMLLEDYI